MSSLNARSLSPIELAHDTRRCEAIVSKATLHWRKLTGNENIQCQKNATVRLGPETLCRSHASQIALDFAIARGSL